MLHFQYAVNMKGLIVFLAVCAFTAAMVPKIRRAVDTEAETEPSSTNKSTIICSERTPCAWSLFRDKNKNIIESVITNTYCICGNNTACQVTDEEGVATDIHKCLPIDIA